ncbi:uncharacterized protein LOC131255920 isoform X2 [Magnolia sinica]|uniref:uncharacterized protein LOC131255920 isoform X2 n=1 Tax=Magnolia sinica TaxID=86752 RepID=UPI00265ADFA8|nr:uncharacterized protein LOC131255920 isoform X2 [Magnolia sinica]
MPFGNLNIQGPEEAVGDRIVGEHKEGFCGSSAKKDKRWAMLLKKHQMSDTGHVPKKILRCFGDDCWGELNHDSEVCFFSFYNFVFKSLRELKFFTKFLSLITCSKD